MFLVSSIASAPQSSFPRIDVARFVESVQKESYPTDSRVKVAISSKSPSSAAALAYVNSVVKEGLCGKAAEAYIKSILNGGSKEAAVGEATRAYITAFNSGEKYKKEELVRLLRERGKMLGLVQGRIMFSRLLLLLSRSGLELKMVILVLLLGLTMSRRSLLVTHMMMLLLLQ